MKKLSKRFLTLAIACVMAMAMAVPTFAAAPKRAAYAGVTYTILSKSNGLYASAQDGTNVQLASYAQKWTPVNDGGTIKLFRGTGNASKGHNLCTYKHICFFPQIKTRPRVADALIISASAIRSSFLNHT